MSGQLRLRGGLCAGGLAQLGAAGRRTEAQVQPGAGRALPLRSRGLWRIPAWPVLQAGPSGSVGMGPPPGQSEPRLDDSTLATSSPGAPAPVLTPTG